MNLDYSPVFGEGGKPAGVIAVVVETSLRVAAERKVQQNEARLLFLGALGKETAKVTTRTRSWDHDEDTGEYLEVAS
jgi:hypothetical protein